MIIDSQSLPDALFELFLGGPPGPLKTLVAHRCSDPVALHGVAANSRNFRDVDYAQISLEFLVFWQNK